jgi:hypothetical protein
MIELDPEREEILNEFHHRCIYEGCGKITNTVHEMLPRAFGRKAMRKENRIPLCLKHHSWAHDVGAAVSRPILTEMREKALARC